MKKRITKTTTLINKKFGKLTVKKYLGIKKTKNNSQRLWLCECKCGNKKELTTTVLTSKNTKSCGCGQAGKNFLSKGEASFNTFYYDYKRKAIKNKITFNLTKDDVKNITQRPCYYCGKPPTHKYGSKTRTKNGFYIANGIDKKIPSKGYIKSNCVSCCISCNFFKKDLTSNEFLKLIRKIYKWISDEH